MPPKKQSRSRSPSRSPIKKTSTKRKSTKTSSPSGKPKRARNAYNFFYEAAFPELKEKYPGLPVTELATKAGARWSRMSEAQKAPFQAKAEKDKARSKRERDRIAASKPKREPSDYIVWATANRPIMMHNYPKMTFGEISTELGRIWKEGRAQS